jgi:hypothetical protein
MEQKTSQAALALKWGVISALATIILSTAINISGLWKVTGVSMLAFIPMIVILVLCMKEFREGNSRFMAFGEGLSVGMLMSAVSALISSLWGLIYASLIDPTFMGQIREYQIEQMEEKGLADEQIEAAMKMTEKFSNGSMTFLFGLLGTLFFAFIFSLIISAILKKNRPVF